MPSSFEYQAGTWLEHRDAFKMMVEAYNTTQVIPVSVITHDNGNPVPATADMYLLLDDAYLYMFAKSQLVLEKHLLIRQYKACAICGMGKRIMDHIILT